MSNQSRILAILFSVALGCQLAAWDAPATAGDPVAIVVNPSNSVASLTPTDLHKIFLGDKSTWPNGKHILVIMAAPGSPERGAVLAGIYKMSESEYAKYFLQAAFTGAVAAPPKDATSSTQVKQLVAENPGAIGYIKQADADDTVKVVFKLP
jgi:ABC-type phosphate transport system substrate-binding protein